MILLIDNYDSFSYNLYQLVGSVEPDIKVIRNDECTLELMHGKKKEIEVTGENQLFRNLPEHFPAARYHSLAAEEETLPKELKVTARCEDGEVMAVEHETYPIFGVQFHPESVMTPDGRQMIENFMEVVRND